jgi:hypothetical protein
MKIRLKFAGIAALAAAVPAFAQVKVNDSLTVTGWAVGSYQYLSPSAGPSSDSLNIDAGLLQATLTPTTAKKVTAVFSLYYRPSGGSALTGDSGGVSPSGSEATLLDAYVTYAASDTVNITAGKFLSYLGYESFYLNQDNMITLANQQLLAPIPGYHEGIKLDYSPDKTDTMGVAVVDSLYQKPGYAATEGDGSLKHQAGFEGYYTNTAITNLTVWAGVGYETTTKPGYDTGGITEELGPKGAVIQNGNDVYVLDLWASYVIDKNNDQFAAEEIYKDGGYLNKGSNWLLYYQYNYSSKISSWFCVSGEDVTGGASYMRYSVSPTYTYNSSLAFRLQYSYTDYKSYTIKDANYFGAEVLFKF